MTNRNSRTLWAGGLAAACLAIALTLLPGLLRGDGTRRPTQDGKLVMHEWGTFTSFAGSDGVNLEFRPLLTRDLPKFVFPGDPLGKRDLALQRMETPVVYFYTAEPRVVQVRVDFPQGKLTDWYPAVKDDPSAQGNFVWPYEQRQYLNWGDVRLTPAAKFSEIRMRGRDGVATAPSLPAVAADDHYGRARETDSAIVETVDANRGSHFEKFLFYRGIGNFELPIKLVAQGSDRFEIANMGDDASGALLLVRIENGRVRFKSIAPLGPHAKLAVELPAEESTVDRLAEAMASELTAAGLFEKESLAMVNTWRTSWFGEQGTRLLYLVPEKSTDRILPLSIQPAPDESVRVLVGRLETLTPEDTAQLVLRIAGDPNGEAPSAEAVQAELAKLGRFAEPALCYVLTQSSNPTTRTRLEALLAELRPKN